MPKFVLGVVTLVLFAGVTPAATAVKKKTTPHRSTPAVASTAKGKKPVHPAVAQATAARTSTARATRRAKAPIRQVAHSYVAPQPTPERYQQIQQALADKGYYKGETSGQWNAESMDALKRFQSDQNLTSDGKLNSLSLIALGLGPKRITAQAAPAPVKPPPPAAAPAIPEPGVRQ